MKSRGFTLLEVLVVMLIIGIIASAAIPSGFSSSDKLRLDHAALEIATGFRLARDESISTGSAHGVHLDQVTERIYVFKAGTGANPMSGISVLPHPLTKHLFDYVLSDAPFTEGIDVTNSQAIFSYSGSVLQTRVLFDEQGTPFWKGTDGIYHILQSANVQLEYAGQTKTVVLAPGYGRVMIQ